MHPIEFKEQTAILAKDQPEYLPLPVCITPTEQLGVNQYTCKYELTDLEVEQIIRSKSIFFSQFGNCFHPIRPTVENQLMQCRVEFKNNPDNTYTFWIPMQDKTIEVLNNITLENAMIEVMKWGNLQAEQICFIEKT